MKETFQDKKKRISGIDRILSGLYADGTALHFENTLQLLIATILSAQCTDERVNRVTPDLFEKYPDASAFAGADLTELEEDIHSTGFFRQKAKSIKGCCEILVRDHGGKVPSSLEEMVRLPGVGRKTANLVLGIAEGVPGVVVDTHVKRVAFRMGLTDSRDPEMVERDLSALLPEDRWLPFSSELIFLGRDKCAARKTKCGECPVEKLCLKIGVVTKTSP